MKEGVRLQKLRVFEKRELISIYVYRRRDRFKIKIIIMGVQLLYIQFVSCPFLYRCSIKSLAKFSFTRQLFFFAIFVHFCNFFFFKFRFKFFICFNINKYAIILRNYAATTSVISLRDSFSIRSNLFK